jgi:hypothetical protein
MSEKFEVLDEKELEKMLGKAKVTKMINEKEEPKKTPRRNDLINFDLFINYGDSDIQVIDLPYEVMKQITSTGRIKKEPHVSSFFDIPLNQRTFFDNEKADYALAYNLVHSRVIRLSRKKIYFEITDDPNFGLLEKEDRYDLVVMQFMIMLDIEDPNDEAVIKFKKKHKMEV